MFAQTVWVKGTPLELSDGTGDAYTTAVFVSDSNVYGRIYSIVTKLSGTAISIDI